jgi:hypothetical protein
VSNAQRCSWCLCLTTLHVERAKRASPASAGVEGGRAGIGRASARCLALNGGRRSLPPVKTPWRNCREPQPVEKLPRTSTGGRAALKAASAGLVDGGDAERREGIGALRRMRLLCAGADARCTLGPWLSGQGGMHSGVCDAFVCAARCVGLYCRDCHTNVGSGNSCGPAFRTSAGAYGPIRAVSRVRRQQSRPGDWWTRSGTRSRSGAPAVRADAQLDVGGDPPLSALSLRALIDLRCPTLDGDGTGMLTRCSDDVRDGGPARPLRVRCTRHSQMSPAIACRRIPPRLSERCS